MIFPYQTVWISVHGWNFPATGDAAAATAATAAAGSGWLRFSMFAELEPWDLYELAREFQGPFYVLRQYRI